MATKERPEPSSSRVKITPEMAEKWLGTTNPHANRALRPRLVEKFANIILNKQWHLNGETIKFDWDGNLIDGQHRLQAIVMAGESVECFVVRGLPPITRATIDIGARRTLADWLRMNGESDSINLATTLNWIYRLRLRDPRIPQTEYPSYEQSLNLLNKEPGIRDTLEEWRNRFLDISGKPTLLCALLYIFESVDPDNADEFAEKLWTGEDLKAGSPILAVRKLLQNDRVGDRRQSARTSSVGLAACMIKAFNFWRTNRIVTTLYWRGSGPSAELFPHIFSPEEVETYLGSDADEA